MSREQYIQESPSQKAWRRLKRNKGAMIGLFAIILFTILGIFAPHISPDKTVYASYQILELENRAPGYSIDVLKLHKNKLEQESGFWKRLTMGKDNPYQLIPIKSYQIQDDVISVQKYNGETRPTTEERYKLTDVVYSMSLQNDSTIRNGEQLIFKDVLENEQQVELSALQSIVKDDHIARKKYWLGSDKYGRDILSRLLNGIRVSLSVGLIAVLISLLIGITLGALAGFFKGRVDDAIMWVINVMWSIPTLLLVFAINFALGGGFWTIFMAVGLTMWVEVARIIRGQVMSIRELEYIEATRALGFSNRKAIIRHVLPNVLGPVMVIAAANFATAILIEAGLSFLGIGVQPPIPSWGMMMKENFGMLITNKPFLAIIPGIAIMIMVLAFNLLGNGLRDAIDVKSLA